MIRQPSYAQRATTPPLYVRDPCGPPPTLSVGQPSTYVPQGAGNATYVNTSRAATSRLMSLGNESGMPVGNTSGSSRPTSRPSSPAAQPFGSSVSTHAPGFLHQPVSTSRPPAAVLHHFGTTQLRTPPTVAMPQAPNYPSYSSDVVPVTSFPLASRPSQEGVYYPTGMPTHQQLYPSSTFSRQSDSRNSVDVVRDTIHQYQSRVDVERNAFAALEQEELDIAAEEADLRRQLHDLDCQKRRTCEEIDQMDNQWPVLFQQLNWFHTTPFLDLGQEVAESEYRCAELEHHLHERQQVLIGAQLKLNQFQDNDATKQNQMATVKMLRGCFGILEKRRGIVRATAERHFEAEAQRERASQRYVADLERNMSVLESKFGAASKKTFLQFAERKNGNSSAASVTTVKSYEVEAQRPGSRPTAALPQRPRTVKFDPSPAPYASCTTIDRMFAEETTNIPADGGFSSDSICFGLDDDSQSVDVYGGLDGNSIALTTLHDTKRRRTELPIPML